MATRFLRTQTAREYAFEEINKANYQTSLAISMFDCAKDKAFEDMASVVNILKKEARNALKEARKHLENAKIQRVYGYKYRDIP